MFQAFKANETMLDADFMFLVADYFAVAVQYGNRTGLCNLMN
jgi:hypothetical protein